MLVHRDVDASASAIFVSFACWQDKYAFVQSVVHFFAVEVNYHHPDMTQNIFRALFCHQLEKKQRQKPHAQISRIHPRQTPRYKKGGGMEEKDKHQSAHSRRASLVSLAHVQYRSLLACSFFKWGSKAWQMHSQTLPLSTLEVEHEISSSRRRRKTNVWPFYFLLRAEKEGGWVGGGGILASTAEQRETWE